MSQPEPEKPLEAMMAFMAENRPQTRNDEMTTQQVVEDYRRQIATLQSDLTAQQQINALMQGGGSTPEE